MIAVTIARIRSTMFLLLLRKVLHSTANRMMISNSNTKVTTVSVVSIKRSLATPILELRRHMMTVSIVITTTKTGSSFLTRLLIVLVRRDLVDMLSSSSFSWIESRSSPVNALALLSSRMTWKEDVMTAMSRLTSQKNRMTMPAAKNNAAAR